MHNTLVSIVVPTKNSSATLERCLRALAAQTHRPIEIIVVDNFSQDSTLAIAKRYANRVLQHGPERSTQRNIGTLQARGEFVAIIDSDMELSPTVIEECVRVAAPAGVAGVIIPEQSFGEGFWAKCKELERSFYVGVPWMEAARFFKKNMYIELGGYNESLIGGEDWDLSQRAAAKGALVRIRSYIYHNEGRIGLVRTVRKKFYYAKHMSKYLGVHQEQASKQTNLGARYRLFFSQPDRLLRDPLVGAGMLFMKTCEFGFGGLGMLLAKKL